MLWLFRHTIILSTDSAVSCKSARWILLLLLSSQCNKLEILRCRSGALLRRDRRDAIGALKLYYIHRVHEKVSQIFFAITSIFYYFHQIWQVAAALNAEQWRVKATHFTWRVYAHYLDMLRDRVVTKYCIISHSFQQKLTQDLRQKKLFAWNKLWCQAFCLLC